MDWWAQRTDWTSAAMADSDALISGSTCAIGWLGIDSVWVDQTLSTDQDTSESRSV